VKRRATAKKILCWGTFDRLHAGHREFLQRAALLGDLYVIVVPDEVVIKNKGRPPMHRAEERSRAVAAVAGVKEVHIDSLEHGSGSVFRIRPEVFCVGYDQRTPWEERLLRVLNAKGIACQVVRLGCYANGLHSSQLRPSFA